MHTCVKELLGNAHKPKGEKADLEEKPDEEKIQCLCTLMTTIGYKLEDAAIANKEKKPEQEKDMKMYVSTLKKLGESRPPKPSHRMTPLEVS